MNRRNFLKTGTLAAIASIGLPRLYSQTKPGSTAALGYTHLANPERKLRIAAVGAGGRAFFNINGLIDTGLAEIVALCDVDFSRAGGIFALFPSVPRFKDYREMLEKMKNKIDAVVISTPDHMHFPVALLAINMGKHVYVEKPLTHTITEARILKAAAKRAGVVTQMGNQGHANEGTRLLKEWVGAGVIGKVHEVHAWTNRPSWPQGIILPEPSGEIPETLDWNLWQGVARLRDYSPEIVPFKWRGFWEYGCGAIGDMACHIIDAPFWALNLRGNCKVSAKYEKRPGWESTAPSGATITYEFPARGEMPPCKMVWHEGSHTPPLPAGLPEGAKLGRGGAILFGEKGTIMDETEYGSSPKLIPGERMAAFKKRPPKTIPRIPGGNQYAEWIKGCQGIGPVPGSNIVEHSADLTEVALLGNVAMRVGKRIEWDYDLGLCANAPEASRFLNKHYREF